MVGRTTTRPGRKAASAAIVAVLAGCTASDLSAAHLVEKGKPAPAFELPAIDGRTVAFRPGGGRAALTLFARPDQARSLLAAREAAIVLEALRDAPCDAYLVVPGAFPDREVRRLVERAGWHTPVLLDRAFRVAARYGLIACPAAVISARDGRVSFDQAGYSADFEILIDAELRFALGRIDAAAKARRIREARARGAPGRKTAEFVELARRLAREGEPARAEAVLEQALRMDPSSFAVRCARADILLDLRRWAEALEILDALAQESPRSARVHLARGRALVGLDRAEEAEKALREAVRLSPSPGRAHYELGKLYEARGDKDRALRQYRLAIEDLLKSKHW